MADQRATMSGESKWTTPRRWADERPVRCEVCGETFAGREASYLPMMCEQDGCPETEGNWPGRGDLIEVVPAADLDRAVEALRVIAVDERTPDASQACLTGSGSSRKEKDPGIRVRR